MVRLYNNTHADRRKPATWEERSYFLNMLPKIRSGAVKSQESAEV